MRAGEAKARWRRPGPQEPRRDPTAPLTACPHLTAPCLFSSWSSGPRRGKPFPEPPKVHARRPDPLPAPHTAVVRSPRQPRLRPRLTLRTSPRPVLPHARRPWPPALLRHARPQSLRTRRSLGLECNVVSELPPGLVLAPLGLCSNATFSQDGPNPLNGTLAPGLRPQRTLAER